METKYYNPKVSIIIPVYNGANFLKKAIDSALNQTYKNIEIIVVNDGSTDENKTEDIILKYGAKIKYFKKKNGGVSSALNLGIKNMTGEYFSWLSHDDMYYSHKIEEQIKFINENNLKGKDVILYSDYSIIDENDNITAICKKNHKEIEQKPEYTLLRGNLNGITILIPKRAFDDFGYFDENLMCAQDYDMWKKMMKKYKFIHQESVLSMTRVHENQDTHVNPKVITEGNQIWLDLIEDVSDARKIEIEGSIYKYYEEMSNFLSETPYNEAKKHCDSKMKEIEDDAEKKLKDIKVSVIIPFYNRVDLTINAINSVLNQTHKNIEIVLINDGSTEDTQKLEIYINNKIVKYIDSKENHGTGYSRNTGIKNATGDYIAFLDNDDIFLETKIEKQLKKMILYKAIFSHTSYIKKDYDGYSEIIETGNLKGRLYPNVIGGCTIATPTVMIKRDYLIKNNIWYIDNLSLGEDICFYIQLLQNIDVVGIKEPLSIVNINEKSTAYNYEKQLDGIKNILRFVLKSEEHSRYNWEIYRLFKEFIRVYNVRHDIYDGINRYMEENEKLCKQLMKLETKYNNSENAIILLNNEIKDLMQSTSWKVTAPLRKISLYIKEFFRKIKRIIKRKGEK